MINVVTNLLDTTFLIPIRIESRDRLRNIITVLRFLTRNFDTNIIVKEVDVESNFLEFAMPQLLDIDGNRPKNLIHIFEKSDDEIFHRTKIINEMVEMSQTKVVVNYDSDVLLPLKSYEQSSRLILENKVDVMYPYDIGYYQFKVKADDAIVNGFVNDFFNFNYLIDNSEVDIAEYGHVQFFDRDVYVKGGLENENFIGWAPEDRERYHRFVTMGYKVGRLNSVIYHLEHERGINSSKVNPYMAQNDSLWEELQKMTKEELEDYYSKQSYISKYN